MHLAKPPYDGSFFLIDPLDGTKEFVAGRNEFTVNLALVTQRHAAVGHHRRAGARIDLARAGRPRRGAADDVSDRRPRGRADPYPPLPASAASPGSRPSAARMAMPGPKPSSTRGPARSGRSSARRSNSAGWRRARVDIYPRLAPTCEWDVAAGHAIVTAAGGKITDAQGRRLAVRQRRARILSCRNSSPGAIPRRRR